MELNRPPPGPFQARNRGRVILAVLAVGRWQMDSAQHLGATPALITDSDGNPIPPGLARELSDLAREMRASTDPVDLLDRIVHAAVVEIPGSAAAGITMAFRDRLTTGARTDAWVDHVDRIQYDARQGPCVHSSRRHETVRADDLRTADRWPSFARGAVEIGVRSMLSTPLFVRDNSFGALNLYAREPYAFDRDAESAAVLFAAHAAVAMDASRKEENLRIALATREVIGEAKGILMERFKVSSQQAFDMLIVVSQRSHRKLREVAEELTNTGELPRVR